MDSQFDASGRGKNELQVFSRHEIEGTDHSGEREGEPA